MENTKALEAAAACYSRNATAQVNFVEGAKYALEHRAELEEKTKDLPENHEDRLYVSSEYGELKYVADKFGIKRWQVLRIKEENNVSLRSEVYQYIEHELKS